MPTTHKVVGVLVYSIAGCRIMVCGCRRFINSPRVGVTRGNVATTCLVADCEVNMKIYCVTFWVEKYGTCEMCYPSMDAQGAIKLCEKDFPDAKYYVAEEV